MTIMLDIPDETWQAVEQEATHQNVTPKERLERLVEVAHRFWVEHPRRDRSEELDRMAQEQGIDPNAPRDGFGEVFQKEVEPKL